MAVTTGRLDRLPQVVQDQAADVVVVAGDTAEQGERQIGPNLGNTL
jgi:hypothetical protein